MYQFIHGRGAAEVMLKQSTGSQIPITEAGAWVTYLNLDVGESTFHTVLTSLVR
jgi:hypothetical protein